MTVTENRLPVERAAGCAGAGTDGPSPAGNWSSMFADHFKLQHQDDLVGSQRTV